MEFSSVFSVLASLNRSVDFEVRAISRSLRLVKGIYLSYLVESMLEVSLFETSAPGSSVYNHKLYNAFHIILKDFYF